MKEYLRLALYPEIQEAFQKIKGVKRAILSNGSPDMLEPLVKHSGLELDAVLSVDAVKVFKPAPVVYELAVKALGLPKQEIGFVSSNGWDALGAKAYGFKVFWVNRAGAPLDRLDVRPDRTLASLLELA
jgi:2-haloacid dehalogenase